MLSSLRRWLQGSPSLQLHVEGTITETGTHQPQTHLGAAAAPTEAWLGLAISKAQLSNGTAQPIQRIVPAEFSGALDLLERFSVGDRVCITTTTATGREIAHIELQPTSE